jgi:hypothetical protein
MDTILFLKAIVLLHKSGLEIPLYTGRSVRQKSSGPMASSAHQGAQIVNIPSRYHKYYPSLHCFITYDCLWYLNLSLNSQINHPLESLLVFQDYPHYL